MKESGRLIEYRKGLCTNIKPLLMTYEELIEGYSKLIRQVYSYDSYAERYLTSLRYMRNHGFQLDRPRFAFRNHLNFLRTIAYYLCTSDGERWRFFFRMILGTLKIQPRGWRWTLRYLCNFIHFHRYANVNVMVVLAPFHEAATKTETAIAS